MDTITLQEALAGFTANESAALGSYIGLSSGGAGQKQSIAALAKVAGDQAIAINADTDLNEDYLEPGRYYCSSGTIAATLSNSPVRNSAFALDVLKASGTYRVRVVYGRSAVTVPALYVSIIGSDVNTGWFSIGLTQV